MTNSTIAFIGLGLIGGSIARGIKREKPDTKIMAYMRTRSRLLSALDEGVIDVILDGVNEQVSECDLIFLCTPVEYNARYLAEIKPFLKPGAIITRGKHQDRHPRGGHPARDGGLFYRRPSHGRRALT